MQSNLSLLASEHKLTLATAGDALNVIGSGLPGCIFTSADLHPEFFNLRNGMAGDVFQKFVNYNYPVAFIVPEAHDYGDRVTELIRDHRNHPVVRFFHDVKAANNWLA